MSTRSFIGTVNSEGRFRGRYVHSDGYPSGLVPVLTELIARADGSLSYVLKVITKDHPGWSYIHPVYAENFLDDRGELVNGFGLAYTVESGQASWNEWLTGTVDGRFDEDNDMLCEWGYVFTSTNPSKAELVILCVYGLSGAIAHEVKRVPVRELPAHGRAYWRDFENSIFP